MRLNIKTELGCKGQRKRKSQGFALVAVMWLVAFLSMILSVTLLLVKVESEVVISDEHTFRAWQLAHTGLSYASHPNVSVGDPVLNYEPDKIDESYKVRIRSEASKINLNYVIRVEDKSFLRALFYRWLKDDDKATALSDAFIDWVDSDDLVSLNGAESDWYSSRGFENRPFNRSFQSLDEIRLVKGFKEVEAIIPNWRDWFTLISEGGIDIHDTEPNILSVAAGVELADAERFLNHLMGYKH